MYKFKISVNAHYDATKGKEYNNDKVAKGWSLTELEWTEPSVRDLTTQHGISCNEFSTEHKVTENWVGTNAIMLDFDNGVMTKEMLLDEQSQWKFDSYVYSSQNHQKPKEKDYKIEPAWDRLRVLIPLYETIKSTSDLKAVKKIFMEMFPEIDKSFMGQARYFAHGTTEVSSYRNSQGPLNWRELPGLNEVRKTVSALPSWGKKKDSVIRLNDKVLNADEQECLISDVLPDTPIYCPFCGKSKERSGDAHNAVIKINEDDLPFIFCSSCQSRGQGNQGVYNFHEIDGYIYRLALDDKLVFIDTLQGKYMGGCHEDGLTDFVVRDLGGKELALQFCKYHEIPYPSIYPRARFELVFNSDERAEFDKGYVNKYSVTDLLKAPVPVGHVAKLPKYIGRLISHIMTDDTPVIDRFYNDLAWFVQNRRKLITSYLWQGVEGTGKGFFFSKVLQPILGTLYCAQADQDAFGTQFNSFLTDNILVLINEVSGNFSASEGKNLSTIEKMKIAITDEHIQIEGKNRDRFNGKNVCSFLFATNRRDAITLSENDRRFNVAPRQEVKLHDTSWWPGYQQLLAAVESELQEFVWYLKQYQVDVSLIGKVIENEPKRILQTMSKTNMEMFFDAVQAGELAWLNEHLIMEDSKWEDSIMRNVHIQAVVDNLDGKDRVSSKDLCDLYNNINGKNLTTVSFGRIAAGHLGTPKPIKIDGKTPQGYKIDWKSKKK
jgi:hypothetical protein